MQNTPSPAIGPLGLCGGRSHTQIHETDSGHMFRKRVLAHASEGERSARTTC